jgi:hypothetical protein
MALPATDAFTRADSTSSAGPSWTNISGSGGVFSNECYFPTSPGVIIWNADTFANDHYAQCVAGSFWSLAIMGPGVRVQSDDGDGYYHYNGRIFRYDAGSATELGSSDVPASTDTIKMEAEGTAIRYYLNTVLKIDVTDATYGTGGVGIRSDSASITVDNFEADDIGGGGGGAEGAAAYHWRRMMGAY